MQCLIKHHHEDVLGVEVQLHTGKEIQDILFLAFHTTCRTKSTKNNKSFDMWLMD